MTPAALRRLARSDRPDGDLLAAFAADRDEAAFAELVRRHGPLVWGVCRRHLSNPADAEDAFQAAFLVLVRRADRLTAAGSVGPWLHRVAVLTARDLRKRLARRAARLSPLPDDVPARPVPDCDVDDLLLALPDRDRAAVVLCCLEGLTQRAAAAQLGVPEGTLSARLSRGLARLRRRYAGGLPAVVPVPFVLCESTAKAAAAVGLAAAVSPGVIHLAEGVLRMFVLKKAAAAVGCVLAVGLALGVGTRFGTVTAEDAPPADPVAKASAELDKRIAELQRLLDENEKKKKVVDDLYAEALSKQKAELQRLEQAKQGLTGRLTAKSEITTVVLAVQIGDLPHFTIYEKDAKDQAHSIAQVFTDAALARHLRRLKADPACPKTITLTAAKDAPWARTQAAIDAIKAAGFENIQATMVERPADPKERLEERRREVAAEIDAVSRQLSAALGETPVGTKASPQAIELDLKFRGLKALQAELGGPPNDTRPRPVAAKESVADQLGRQQGDEQMRALLTEQKAKLESDLVELERKLKAGRLSEAAHKDTERAAAGVRETLANIQAHILRLTPPTTDAQLRAIDREKLSAEVAKLEDELAFVTKAAKAGYVPQTKVDEARVKLSEQRIKLKQLDAQAKPPAEPADRITTRTLAVGDKQDVRFGSNILAVAADARNVAKYTYDDDLLRVTAVAPGTVQFDVELVGGKRVLVTVPVGP